MSSEKRLRGMLPQAVTLEGPVVSDVMKIDMSRHAFRGVGNSLAVGFGAMQTAVAVMLGALAIARLFNEPFTNRFGRCGPRAFGILPFVLAPVVAALSQSSATFMIRRGSQSLGAAIGWPAISCISAMIGPASLVATVRIVPETSESTSRMEKKGARLSRGDAAEGNGLWLPNRCWSPQSALQ